METMANIRSICHTIIAVFSEMTDLAGQKQFKPFMLLYNTGLPFMAAMLFARGIPRRWSWISPMEHPPPYPVWRGQPISL